MKKTALQMKWKARKKKGTLVMAFILHVSRELIRADVLNV